MPTSPTAQAVPDDAREAIDFDPSDSAGFFVGVSQFEDRRFAEIPYAVDDAVDLAYLFALELRLVIPTRVSLGLSGVPRKPESQERLAALLAAGAAQSSARQTEIYDQLRIQGREAGERGLFLVTVSTHGFSDRGGDYLLAADSLNDRLFRTAVAASDLLEDLARSRAPRRLVLLDAARERLHETDPRSHSPVAGSENRPTQPRHSTQANDVAEVPLGTRLATAIGASTGQAVLASATIGGFAYDNPERRNSVFTAAVLDGLRGGAPVDARGFITVQSLANYVDLRVVAWIQENQPGHEAGGIARSIEGAASQLPLAIDLARLAERQLYRRRREAALARVRDNLGEILTGALYDEIAARLAGETPSPGNDELLEQIKELDGRARSQRSLIYFLRQQPAGEARRAPAVSRSSRELPWERWYLRKIELENIRGFHRLALDLDASGEPQTRQTVVIGRNGTCKTTLLRAISLGLTARHDIPALLSIPNGNWISEGKPSGIIRLLLESPSNGIPEVREIRLVADPSGERAEFPRSTFAAGGKIFLCGYGLGRCHLGGEAGRDYRIMDSVATLFHYDERLVDSELVLRRLYDYLGGKRFDAVLASFKRALGLGPEHGIELAQGGGVEISGPDLGARIPLAGWADGYRITFSWLIDFYGWAMRAGAFDAEGEVCGILLVDELEQHLHPAMQRTLLAQLGRALPRVQIVATTHSPLVALSAQAEQIVALHRDGPRIVRRPVPRLDGYSAEDVLVEDALFGTDPYPPATRRRLDRYRELARIPREDRSPEQAAELRRLAAELDPSATPALRDDPVIGQLDEIKALLSRERSGG